MLDITNLATESDEVLDHALAIAYRDHRNATSGTVKAECHLVIAAITDEMSRRNDLWLEEKAARA